MEKSKLNKKKFLGKRKKFAFAMQKDVQKKFFTKRFFASIGFIGLLIIISSLAWSISLYNNYDFFGQYLSELGIGSTAQIFNFSLIIGALLLIPFFCSLFKRNSFFTQTAVFLSVAAMLFLAGIGLFPIGWKPQHFITAAMFFFCSALAIIFFSVEALIASKKRLSVNVSTNNISRSVFALFGFFTAILSLGYIFFLENPFWQKIAVALIFIWFLLKLVREK